jgi:hypothetical protein
MSDSVGEAVVGRTQPKLTPNYHQSSDKSFRSTNWLPVKKVDSAKQVAPFHAAET